MCAGVCGRTRATHQTAFVCRCQACCACSGGSVKLGFFQARSRTPCSSVAQWQSIRLLTGGFLVRVQAEEPAFARASRALRLGRLCQRRFLHQPSPREHLRGEGCLDEARERAKLSDRSFRHSRCPLGTQTPRTFRTSCLDFLNTPSGRRCANRIGVHGIDFAGGRTMTRARPQLVGRQVLCVRHACAAAPWPA